MPTAYPAHIKVDLSRRAAGAVNYSAKNLTVRSRTRTLNSNLLLNHSRLRRGLEGAVLDASVSAEGEGDLRASLYIIELSGPR